MRACFSDESELPTLCVHDTGATYDCVHASHGIKKKNCRCWDPNRAIALALEILGSQYDTKK